MNYQAPSISSAGANAKFDIVRTGAPLVITFGSYVDPAKAPAVFEFYRRLKKLEAVSGRAINKLFVRDPSMRWYLAGIEGLGDDVASTAAALREHVDRLQPSAVVTVGQSMGAYAAILYGVLIGADKVVAFGPLSCFDGRLWSIMNEARWLGSLRDLGESGIDADAYRDLPRFLADHDGPLPDIDMIYGNSPGEGADPHHAVAIDAMHAVRFANTPAVSLLPIPHALHAVVTHFHSRGVLDEVLRQRIFGTPLAETIRNLDRGDTWIAWLLGSYERGATADDLRTQLHAKIDVARANALITRSKLIVDLSGLEGHAPRFTA